MPRPVVAPCVAALALAFSLAVPTPAPATDPSRVDRALALQSAIADAKDLLTVHKSADAVAVLEKQLPFADGSRAFLDTLRSAYSAEIKRLQIANTDPGRVADLRTKLALLGVTVADEPKPTPEPATKTVPVSAPVATPVSAPPPDAGLDALKQAADAFNQGKTQPGRFAVAARLFATAFGSSVEMTPEHHAAWAYCRVRVAAERLNANPADPQVAAEVAAEVEEALKHASGNAGLQKVGADLIAAAKARAGTGSGTVDAGDVIETASFRVRHGGRKAAGDAVARAAEAKRVEISARWSGPPGGAWEPKCEIVLHSDAAAFGMATGLPAGATGRAVVKLDGGRAVERRIDLRADDATAADDALPRELTHVVLADLFPAQAPPRWAEAGMAVLAASPTEQDRYLRTAIRCHRDGDLVPAGQLLGAAAVPADRVTGWYVGSVSLVDFLVKWKGEKAFTTFLRDSARYGQAQALKRQYGVADVRELDEAWARGALSSARGQAP